MELDLSMDLPALEGVGELTALEVGETMDWLLKAPDGFEGGLSMDLPPVPASPTAVLQGSLPPIIGLPVMGGASAATSEEVGPSAEEAAAAAPAGGQGAGSSSAPAGGKRTLTTKNGKLLTEEQKERIRAKNRRAQNKYREKQKAKAKDTESQYGHVAAELARLRLENAKLQEDNITMEKVLSVRETALGMLEMGREADREAPASAPGQPHTIKGGAPSKGATDKPKLLLKSSIAPPHDLEESVCPIKSGYTPEQMAAIRNRPAESVVAQYRTMVGRLASVLRQMEVSRSAAEPTAAAAQQALQDEMVDALREGTLICFENAVANPTNLQHLMSRSLDNGTSTTQAERSHWTKVAASIQLTRDQLERLAPLRATFHKRMTAVMEQRRAYIGQLRGALEVDKLPTSMKALQGLTDHWLKAHEANSQVLANLSEEHHAGMEFIATAFGMVMSNTQKAKTIVASWPHYPDMYSISTEAMRAAGMLPVLEDGSSGSGSVAGVSSPTGIASAADDFGSSSRSSSLESEKAERLPSLSSHPLPDISAFAGP